MNHYIYTPKSGNRVFSLAPSTDLTLVTWPNGSHHVTSPQLVVLRYETAQPHTWWRDVAKAAARGLPCAHVAWDEYGDIYIAVRLCDARNVDLHMRSVENPDSSPARNEIAIRVAEFRAGLIDKIEPVYPWAYGSDCCTSVQDDDWPRYGELTPESIDAGVEGWVVVREGGQISMWVDAGPAEKISEWECDREGAAGTGVLIYHCGEPRRFYWDTE